MLRATPAAMMLRATSMLREQETWRDHKVSYLQYLNVCTETLHSVVKAKSAAKYTKYSVVGYQAQVMDQSGQIIIKENVPALSSDYGKAAPAQ